MKKLFIILAVGFIGCKKCQTCTTHIVTLNGSPMGKTDNTYVGDSCGKQSVPGDGKTVLMHHQYITKTCISK